MPLPVLPPEDSPPEDFPQEDSPPEQLLPRPEPVSQEDLRPRAAKRRRNSAAANRAFPAPPRGMNDEDRARFAKANSYMVRMDDLVACRKCRKRIELTGQSIALTAGGAAAGGADFDPETFGNR